MICMIDFSISTLAIRLEAWQSVVYIQMRVTDANVILFLFYFPSSLRTLLSCEWSKVQDDRGATGYSWIENTEQAQWEQLDDKRLLIYLNIFL